MRVGVSDIGLPSGVKFGHHSAARQETSFIMRDKAYSKFVYGQNTTQGNQSHKKAYKFVLL